MLHMLAAAQRDRRVAREPFVLQAEFEEPLEPGDVVPGGTRSSLPGRFE